jgi:uroporphyrinogen-III synthase
VTPSSAKSVKANLPLAGRRIVVTRARPQAAALATQLERLGAEVIRLPTIEICPPADWSPLDRAIAALPNFGGIIFTSVNGVRAFFERARELGAGQPARPHGWVCAIGPATAAALKHHEWPVTMVPSTYVAEAVVAALSDLKLDGVHILLPRAAVARDVIPRELERRGARVEVVEAYRTVLPEPSRLAARRLLAAASPGHPLPDAITFTSSSTAENFVRLLDSSSLRRLASSKVVLASIGPVTTATLCRLGLAPSVEAREFTSAGLVRALVEYWRVPSTRTAPSARRRRPPR